MADHSFAIRPAVLDWLLEPNNPSVRYFTLTGILDKPESDKEVIAARAEIMESRWVRKILAAQQADGCWEAPNRFYTAKYRGTVWQLLILAELGADRNDGQIKQACEFILDNSQEGESGGFSVRGGRKGGLRSGVIPCLTGNMLWSLLRFGCGDDPRVQHGIDWVTTYQRFDDGVDDPPQGWPYDQWEICWGRHTCHMGVVKNLKALAEIPPQKRSKAIRNTIEQGAEFMLLHHVHKRSHNLNRISKPGWRRLGFPLMYQTDVLEILGILTSLGYRDDRMTEAVELVLSKQDRRGRWKLENSYNDRVQVNIEQLGKASKWITLNALKVLRRFPLSR
ncbi:MAG: nitrogen fixation protein NifH [Gammaproteobacteria bacterium]|nr:nitrogen fixation protein NifH [Gammaproteobacteria bacterium]